LHNLVTSSFNSKNDTSDSLLIIRQVTNMHSEKSTLLE